MRRLLSVILAFSLFSISYAQEQKNLLDRLYSDVIQSCVTVSYTYSLSISGIKTIGEGVLTAQDSWWKMSGNGLENYCDGENVWIIDPALKEVVLEPVADSEVNYMSNPAVLFMSLDEYFEVRTVREMEDGESELYILASKKECGMEFCNLELRKKDSSIVKAEFAMTDGNLLTIDVSAMSYSAKEPVDTFRPSMSFDSTWIITDLR